MKLISFVSTALLLVPTSAFAGQVKTGEEAIKLTVNAIHKFQLITVKDECAVLDAAEKSTYFEITVRERHGQECGGNVETGPRLFSVRVSKRDGRLTSDAYDGVSYRPINHQPMREK